MPNQLYVNKSLFSCDKASWFTLGKNKWNSYWPFNANWINFKPFLARPCAAPVGIQAGKIKNTAMTASSSYNVFHGPFLARLHRTRTGRYMGAWVARIRNSNQWLQVALGRPMTITGISTQGRHDANQWVTRYLVAFSQDNMHFEYYMEYGTFKVRLCDGELSNN